MIFFTLIKSVESWRTILQDKNGDCPDKDELESIAKGLNMFHDNYAIYMIDAQKFLLIGKIILENLVQNNTFETISHQSLSKSGKKRKLISMRSKENL